jgi:hypothetical protein
MSVFDNTPTHRPDSSTTGTPVTPARASTSAASDSEASFETTTTHLDIKSQARFVDK